jgi:hypothetical protein
MGEMRTEHIRVAEHRMRNIVEQVVIFCLAVALCLLIWVMGSIGIVFSSSSRSAND